jgi:single-stranded DNA-specific DHH superfamily exonuclease
MLSSKQILEIREHLEKAQNPVFFFDNDADGLCSFLLFQRFIGRGKGVSVKSNPDLSGDYFRRVKELNADYVFVLDKPGISEEFLNQIHEVNIPVVWIDHHLTEQKIPNFVFYYNPVLTSPNENIPTTRVCYEVVKNSEDIWLAVAGCIADKHVPDFFGDFLKKYPDLAELAEDAFDIKYNSLIGKIVRIFEFALKDRTSSVVQMLRFLREVKSPYEVLEESNKNKSMHYRFNQIEFKYQKILDKAKEVGKSSGNLLFFSFSGDLSISSEVSNELIYRFPNKLVVVAYVDGVKANISIRGKNARKILMEILDDFENSTGGGHESAVGARIQFQDLDRFRKRIEAGLNANI